MDLKFYLNKARKEKRAIGQFNFSTLEQLRGILAGARDLKSPVILGTSEGESKFLGFEETVALAEISKMKYKIPAFLNYDHGKDLKLIKKAIDFGYSAVHFDGSELPLKKNIKITKEIAKYAHKKGVLVEGELGYIKGSSVYHKENIKIRKQDFTKLKDIEKFIKETEVDSLAVSIGNIHGICAKMPNLDFDRLKEIQKRAGVFLVLHGASGIPKREIKKAIKLGIVKININTELRLAWRKSLEDFFKNNSNEIKPYRILPRVEKAVQKKVEEKIKIFNF